MKKIQFSKYAYTTMVVFFIIFSGCSTKSPQFNLDEFNKNQKESELRKKYFLGQLNSVIVLVDINIEQRGLTAAFLQADIQQRLKNAGIRLLSKDEIDKSEGVYKLSLYVNIKTNESGISGYDNSFSVSSSTGDPKLFYGNSQNYGSTPYIESKKINDIKEQINKLVDQFISDYLAAR